MSQKMGDHEKSPFMDILTRALNFVTTLSADTYQDRRSQRCAPTFVLAAGNVLRGVYERGGLRTKAEFGMGDLTALMGHLNIWWMASELAGRIPVDELAEDLRGVGYSFHMTDDEIADWQRFIRSCAGSDSAFQRLLAHFDRIIEPIATISGAELPMRWHNWTLLLRDIGNAYHGMMENREWIAELDLALARTRTDQGPPIS